MGDAVGRQMNVEREPSSSEHGPLFWIAFIAGGAIMAYGVVGALQQSVAVHPAAFSLWIVGADIAHDFVLTPIVLLIGAVVARVLPEPWRTPIRAGLLLSALLVAVAWPSLRGYGRANVPDNHSVQPLNYATALGTALAVVWIAVAIWCVVRVLRRNGVN
jgi:hypothetical protein